MGELGKKPIQIVEIDLPQCTRTYGSAPCTAILGTTGTRKCFNSIKTCQDTANFLAADLTLRFARNQSGLPKGQTIFPALANVSTRAGRLNLSGIDPSRSALGQRARVTVALQDFTYQDTLTDNYQAQRVSGAAESSGIGYDPKERGTFFAKLKARWPYYLGRSLRVLEGYEGDALSAMRTRNYVITDWSGPNAAGVVQITAKDVLDLADNAKSQAPAPSRGKLAAAISAVAASFDVSPATVGAEYSASGLLAVGRELMRFTRSGDTFTITERGAEGTEATDHSEGDVVQEALEYSGLTADVIIADLLTTYAGIDAAFIDSTAWAAETERWLGGTVFSAIIVKPEGVAKLVGELCQHGILCWWDEVAQEIRLRLNRPLDLDDVYYPITDAAGIVEGTADIEDATDERASQIWFWHGVIDPTEGVDNSRNFRKLYIASDLTLEGDDYYGESRVKEFRTRWFGTNGDDANASVIADRLIFRYRNTPVNFTCEMDVKDLASIDLATLVEINSRLMTDDTGAIVASPMQVMYREETEPGHRFRIEAQTFTSDGRFGFIMLDSANDYPSATAAEINQGAYIVDHTTLVFSDATGPYVFF